MPDVREVKGEEICHSVLKQPLRLNPVFAQCAASYAVPDDFRDSLRKSHQTFYCPNGHNQYFPAETEAENLRKRLIAEKETSAAMNRERERLQQELNQREKKIKQMKRRATAGVCQFCHRHFANVENHMHTKHPDEVVENANQ